MSDPVKALLNVPCAQHAQDGAVAECPTCGTPVAVHAELVRLRARVAELEPIEQRAERITRNRLRDNAERHVAHEILGNA